MASSAPRVSIGMPVYNAEHYLAQELESLLGQSYGDFELVISDNASADGTEAICREYARRDGRVRYVRQPENRGAAWNFNEVFRLSRGELFKWAAYDDVCRPQFLERCVAMLDSDPGLVWCHTMTNHMTADGLVVSGEDDPEVPPGQIAHSLVYVPPGGPQVTRSSPRASQRFAAVLLGTTWCSDSYGVIRSDVLRRTRLVLPYYGAEKVLMAELSLLGRFGEVSEPLFLHRVHPQASGQLLTAGQQDQYMQPGVCRSFSSRRLRLLRGFWTAALRADLPTAERMRCLTAVVRYVLQVSKWRQVAAQVVSGRSGRRSQALSRPSRKVAQKGRLAWSKWVSGEG